MSNDQQQTPTTTEKPTNKFARPAIKKPTIPTPVPLLRLGDIVGINYHKKKIKKKEHKSIPHNRLLRLLANINPADINIDKNFHAAPNSIQAVVNSCHPDIRNLFYHGNVLKYKAEAGQLTMELNTGIRLIICPLRGNRNHYKVFQGKHNVLDIEG